MSTSRSLSLRDLRPGDRDHELAATVALSRAGVVPIQRLGALVDQVGSAVQLVQLTESDRIFTAPVAAHEVIGAITTPAIRIAFADVERWRRGDFRVHSVLDPEYPELLHDIFNRPPLLFIRGRWLAGPMMRAIAVVGARKASAAGLQRARRLTAELVDAGFSILSGLAAGIDTAAHSAALEAGAYTAAVMGTGIDRVFPQENAALAEEIVASGGALLSQFFPGQPPTRWSFPMRNVVMSGLALATVVIEASETSGARLQARVALQHGRTVFLLRSLVAEHEWARRFVHEGVYGTRAIEIASTNEIVDRLEGDIASESLSLTS